MSYKLEYPYTEEERNNFIVEYNHNQGLRIEEVENIVDVEVPIENEDGETTTEIQEMNMPTLYALEHWEKLVNGEVIDNTEEYEVEKAKQEAMRIAQLSLTKREVFLAIYQDKGITPEQIRAQITDQGALIEFDYAEKYYRGNPLIDLLGSALGYTKEQLDYLFEYKTFNTTPEEESEINSGDGVDNTEPTNEQNPVTEGVTSGEDVDNYESGGK